MSTTHPEYILVIDDDPANNFLTRRALSTAGYTGQLDVFESAAEALDKLDDLFQQQAVLPDFIFLDINMPRMNGWEFLELVKQRVWADKLGNVVMLTASINPEDEERATALNISRFLRKPLMPRDLENLFEGQ